MYTTVSFGIDVKDLNLHAIGVAPDVWATGLRHTPNLCYPYDIFCYLGLQNYTLRSKNTSFARKFSIDWLSFRALNRIFDFEKKHDLILYLRNQKSYRRTLSDS